MIIDRKVVEAPLPTANLTLAQANDAVIHQYIAGLDRDAIVVRVKSKLVEMLPSGDISERAVAAFLNVSLRTLQRKLGKRPVKE